MTVDDIIHDDHHPNFKRIVGIAIDESDGAQNALQWAAHNVFRDTDLIVLLHSRPNSEVGPFGATYTDADYSHQLSEQFEGSYKTQSHKILRHAIEFLKSYNFYVKAISLKGDAREELTRKVEELKVNLLIIGSRGMGRVKRAFIGSTSDYITHHVHCPVLTIALSARGSLTFEMDTNKAIEATIVYEDSLVLSKRTVAIGMDGSDFSQHALEWAVQNILKPDSDLVVLMNVRPYEQDAIAVTSFGTVDYMESAYSVEVEKEEKKRSEDILQKGVAFLKSCNPKFVVKAIAMVGDPREEIILKTDEIHANIIVVASRGMGAIERYFIALNRRAFIGSTSDHLTHHANCPVIVVKQEAKKEK